MSRPAFREIYPFAQRFTFARVRQLGVPDRDREDVTQKVLFTVSQRLHIYDPSRPLQFWLGGIVRNVVRDYRRLAHHRHEDLAHEADADPDDSAVGAESALVKHQMSQLVHELLDTIEEDRRMVLVMHELDEIPMAEIAVELGIPINTAYSRYGRAREDFKKALERRRKKEEGVLGAAAAPLLAISADQLLVSGRELPEPPEGVRERLWNQVQRALAAAPPPLGERLLDAGGSGRLAAGLQLSPLRLALGTTLVFTLGAGAGAALHAALLRPPPAGSASTDTPLRLAPSVAMAEPPTSAVPVEPLAVGSTGPSAAAGSGSPSVAVVGPPVLPSVAVARPPAAPVAGRLKAGSGPSDRSGDTAVEEELLISSAQTAIAAGDLEKALRNLNQHAARFPQGLFRQEREQLLAQVRAAPAKASP